MTLDVKKAYSDAWEVFKKHAWLFIGVIVVMAAISAAFSFVEEALIDSVAYFVVLLADLYVSLVLGIGLTRMLLNAVEGKKVEFAQIIGEQKYVLRFIGTGILQGLMILAGLILFIVPGVIIALRVQMAQYLILDKDMGVIDSLKASNEMVKGNTGKLFGLNILAILIGFAGFLALLVGTLVAFPVIYLAMTFAYIQLKKGGSSAKKATA